MQPDRRVGHEEDDSESNSDDDDNLVRRRRPPRGTAKTGAGGGDEAFDEDFCGILASAEPRKEAMRQLVDEANSNNIHDFYMMKWRQTMPMLLGFALDLGSTNIKRRSLLYSSHRVMRKGRKSRDYSSKETRRTTTSSRVWALSWP